MFFAEAEQQEQINRATGEARAILAVAEAKAKSIEVISKAIEENEVRKTYTCYITLSQFISLYSIVTFIFFFTV